MVLQCDKYIFKMHFIGLILNDQSTDAFHVFTFFDLIILNSGNVCQSFHTLKLWRFLINQLQALIQIRLQTMDRTKFCLFFFLICLTREC